MEVLVLVQHIKRGSNKKGTPGPPFQSIGVGATRKRGEGELRKRWVDIRLGSKFPKFPGNYGTKSIECNINHYEGVEVGSILRRERERTYKA